MRKPQSRQGWSPVTSAPIPSFTCWGRLPRAQRHTSSKGHLALSQGSASPCASRPSYGDKNKAPTCSFGGWADDLPSAAPPPRGTGKKNQVGLIQLTRCSAFLHGLTRGKPPPPRPPCWASLAGLAFPALTLSPLSPPGATGCPPRPGRQPLCLELLRVTVASRRA